MASKEQFYEDLETAITFACQLPFTVPTEMTDLVVKYGKQYFYRHMDDAIQNAYIFAPYESWACTDSFKIDRSVILPPCVYSVQRVAKTNASKNTAVPNYADFSLEKFMGMGGGFGSTEDQMASDSVLAYTVYASGIDQFQHIFNYPISYEYNRNTRRLFLKGDLKNKPDFVLDVDLAIPDEGLFEDELFFRYCLAWTKMNLGNILGSFQMTLPGGAEINSDRYYDQGEREMEQIKEEIKDINTGGDFFFTTNSL
jgi:hypothetical protein